MTDALSIGPSQPCNPLGLTVELGRDNPIRLDCGVELDAVKPGRGLRQGLLVWGLALLLAWIMPGIAWRQGPAPAFPWEGMLPCILLLAALAAALLPAVRAYRRRERGTARSVEEKRWK